MKVLFIQTDSGQVNMYPSYPLGIGYLATELSDRGHQVKILDLRVEPYELLWDLLESWAPEIIGITIFTGTVTRALKTLKDIRRQSNAVFICGGIHASIYYKDMLRAGFDYVLRGESEKSIIELIQQLECGDTQTFRHNIENKNRLDRSPQNRSFAPINIKKLKLLDRSFFNLDLYKQHTLIASRGCLYSCKYCGYAYHKPLRIRTVEDVLEELTAIAALNCPKEVFFVDNILLGSNWTKIKAMCSGILTRGIQFNWVAQLRPDHLDEEGLTLMRQAGCKSVYFGIESGSQAALTRIGRTMNVKKAIDGVQMAMRHGIFVKSGFIIGLPGKYSEQLKALDLIDQARPNSISFHMLVPYPGTALFKHRKKYGIRILKVQDWDSYDLYQASANIVYDYLPPKKIISLIDHIKKHLASLNYRSGHSSSNSKKRTDYYYSVPHYENLY